MTLDLSVNTALVVLLVGFCFGMGWTMAGEVVALVKRLTS